MRPLYDKVISILSTRRSTTPASFDSADALELLKELHVRARKSATGKANLQMLTSLATFVVRSLLTNSERTNSDVEALSQLYADSLRDFFARKSSQLQVTFFVDTLQRLNPTELPIVWKWVDVVAGYTGPSDVVNVFRQLQAYALLTEICKSFKRYLVVKDANPDLVAATAKTLVLSILERASETFNAAVASDAKGYNANRLKTFLSETHTILRSSQQHLCSDSKPTLAEAGVVTKSLKKSITKSLESIQGNEKFKNSPAILGLIRSLSVTIGLPSDRAADQTGTAGKSGSVRKRKARGSDGDSSEKAQPSQPVMLSGSKKSRK
ncbi:DNA-directed DNA polymerase [Spiromyces aspiralis]|uniref:DNA-directed DNA polymerase n=1 Tax=Spiromyces aspiralis TaxID=68401 RepID=A0ACC1HS55_9FUNG|nr:DNA-directed DNA polymerase [Spiromyces aspiralis]